MKIFCIFEILIYLCTISVAHFKSSETVDTDRGILRHTTNQSNNHDDAWKPLLDAPPAYGTEIYAPKNGSTDTHEGSQSLRDKLLKAASEIERVSSTLSAVEGRARGVSQRDWAQANQGQIADSLRLQSYEHQTEQGVVTGLLEFSEVTQAQAYRRRYYAFRGIPYAEPPVEELRWADPVPMLDQWPSRAVDGRADKHFCPQYDHDIKEMVGNEDCLYLNVFTPYISGNRDSLLPVLVFLHGGTFTRGAGSAYGPGGFMTKDVVLVTLNYRLGVLGFLSSETEELPGNYGALDQVAALQWVQRHIRQYGGNPREVTLGGFSSGAAMAHLHMMSPLSKGLFTRALLMSGTANCAWAVQPRPLETAEHLAADVGCDLSDLACLRATSAEDLIRSQSDRRRTRYAYWPFLYRPTIDADLRTQPFLPAPLDELMTAQPINSVPVLAGTTRNEGLLFALTTLLFARNPGNAAQTHDEAAFYLLGCLWPNEASRHQVTRFLHSFYYSQASSVSINVLLEEMTEAMTDQLFTSCVWDAYSHLAATMPFPVYIYHNNYHFPASPAFAESLYKIAQENIGITSSLLQVGVSHGDDIALLFNFPRSQSQGTIHDKRVAEVIRSYWVNFITHGSPQPAGSTLPSWYPTRPGEAVRYFRISLNGGMSNLSFRSKERNLWGTTLQLVENYAEEDAQEDVPKWQIATWVLSGVSIVLLAALAMLAGAIIIAKKRRHYIATTPKLQSQARTSS